MSLKGTLQTMTIADLLQFLEVSQKTGQLKVANPQIQKEVFFEEGFIICSLSNDPRELFGQFLLQRGKLGEGQLQRVMTKHRQTGEKLGRVLVSERLLSESEVVELLTERYVESIYDLFLWEEAHFEFVDGVAPPEDMIPLKIKPSAVVMEGVYRLDGWRQFRRLVPSDRAVFVMTLQNSISSLKLPEDAPRLLFFIGKKMSVGEIILHMRASPFHVYSNLYELARMGLIRAEGERSQQSEAISASAKSRSIPDDLADIQDLLNAGKVEEALQKLQPVLEESPNHESAHRLRAEAERQFSQIFYQSGLTPKTILYLTVSPKALIHLALTQQEGFILSRINDSWDINAILAVSPFREADSLRIIKQLLVKGLVRT
jgi:hypothetical protein